MMTVKSNTIRFWGLSSLSIALIIVLSLFWATRTDAAQQPNPRFSYSVKFVCGLAADADAQAIVRPGHYATEINLHNYRPAGVNVNKRVLILVENGDPVGREPAWVDVAGTDAIALPPNTATMDDCQRIEEITGVNTGVLTIGYLHIVSNRDISVDAVYTSNGSQGTSPIIEVEHIEPNRLNSPND